jgi:DNA-binding XRE family transcriptional regulator
MASFNRRTVREWRAYRRLSKSEVAKQMKVHTQTYSRMEDKPENITLTYAVKLSSVFGCDPKEIIFFEENPNIMLEVVN